MPDELLVDPMFNDHMILQRQKPFPIWGTGKEGEQVRVRCRGMEAEAVVQNGRWRAVLPASEAGGPYELTVESAGSRIIFQDVLFGDVWLAGGQSNMEWPLLLADGGAEEITRADMPLLLRYYDIPRIAWEEDGMPVSTGVWKRCTPEFAPAFSAVAYFFARRLLDAQPTIPIGIIGCNWGGTSAACWVPEQDLTESPELTIYWDEFTGLIRDFDWVAYEQEEKKYLEIKAEYDRRWAATGGKDPGENPWPPPISPKSCLRPCGLYETMLRKAVPYTLKGFLFYQGEADAPRAQVYERLLGKLIRRWRDDWQDDSLPFLYVQLPAYGCKGQPQGEEWALLREAQSLVCERVPCTGMAVTLDCGDRSNLHPTNKQPVGERLALVALELVYGYPVSGQGPLLREMKLQGNIVCLKFDHADGGLSEGEGGLRGFELAGADGVFVPAHSAASGDQVRVWCDEVDNPLDIRYAWANDPDANLRSGLGLPARPFRKNIIEREC